MSCLNDARVQSIADGEAVVLSDSDRAHLSSCARCQQRVRDRESVMQTIGQAMRVQEAMPIATSVRIERALAEGAASGATRLRDSRAARRPWPLAGGVLWSAGAVAIATILAVVFVAPIVKGPATVSAAEILAKSATQLATRAGAGIELLEYDLVLDGVPREMMPDHADGVYRVRQIIDHDATGRYVLATYGPAGQLLSSVAQDPATRRRVVALLIDDQPYRFEFNVPANVALSLPEMERAHMQACVSMMLASGDKSLQVIDTPDGRRYRIQVPQVSGQTTTAVWDLSEAAVVIDATDYHIVEFAVKGTFMKQPYSVSYRLIARSLAAQVSADAFEVPRDPRAIEIEGEGSVIPARDVLIASLREFARLKTPRAAR
jgi:hypothetical protein